MRHCPNCLTEYPELDTVDAACVACGTGTVPEAAPPVDVQPVRPASSGVPCGSCGQLVHPLCRHVLVMETADAAMEKTRGAPPVVHEVLP